MDISVLLNKFIKRAVEAKLSFISANVFNLSVVPCCLRDKNARPLKKLVIGGTSDPSYCAKANYASFKGLEKKLKQPKSKKAHLRVCVFLGDLSRMFR